MSDLKTISDFLFEPGDIVELRAIKGKAPNATIKKFWSLAKDLPGMEDELHILNGQGFNVFFGVNPRKGFGLSKDENVTIARCVFADFDNIAPGDGCGRLEQIWNDIFIAGVDEPDLAVSSGHGLHTYWKLAEPLTDLGRWSRIQKAIAKKINSDSSVHNPERVMRIPGFVNVKKIPHAESFICWSPKNAYK